MKKLHPTAALSLLLVFIAANDIQGDTIIVANPSFETPTTGSYFFAPGADSGGSLPSTPVPDWAFANPGNVGGLSTMGSLTGGSGSQYAFFNSTPGSGPDTITYTGSLPTITAATYTLTVAIANNTATSQAGPATLELELTANGTVLPYATTTVLQSSITSGTFADFTVNLSAADIAANSLAGETLGITLVTDEAPSDAFNGFNQGAFDDIRLSDSIVPEPSTWALIGIGSLALLWQASRKRLA